MDNSISRPGKDNLLRVDALRVYYPVGKTALGQPRTFLRAVDGVSLAIGRGETLGLVGESGCGKSTLGRAILRLEQPTSGRVIFDNQDLLSLSAKALRSVRRHMQPVFQDPFASLNPRKTVRQILVDPYKVHCLYSARERQQKIEELLERVGLKKEHAARYPHEFSGGQRQRIAIARSLALRPSLIIADEAVSALDVSIQAQILNLMVDLQEEFGLAYLFISHDLSVVRHISDRVAVMYLGKIVETAPVDRLYSSPCHPYTRALLSAAPKPAAPKPAAPKPAGARPDPLKESPPAGPSPIDPGPVEPAGELTAPANSTPGCAFADRCPVKTDACDTSDAPLKHLGEGHWVSCHSLDT